MKKKKQCAVLNIIRAMPLYVPCDHVSYIYCAHSHMYKGAVIYDVLRALVHYGAKPRSTNLLTHGTVPRIR